MPQHKQKPLDEMQCDRREPRPQLLIPRRTLVYSRQHGTNTTAQDKYQNEIEFISYN